MIARTPTGTAARLIRALLELLGPEAELVAAHEREWASATFSGARHRIDLRVPLADAASAPSPALAALPEHDFALSGEIVADCVLTTQRRERSADGRYWLACSVELLTVAAD